MSIFYDNLFLRKIIMFDLIFRELAVKNRVKGKDR